MEFCELEKAIKGMARRYARNPADIEDLEQLGRFTAWKVSEEHPSRPQAYYVTSVKNAMLKSLRAERAKKRRPERKVVSLQDSLLSDGTLTIEDSVGVSDSPIYESQDLINTLKGELNRRFGRNYVRGISRERNSKKIVRSIVRATIEDVAKIPKERVPSDANYDFFVKMGLGRLLWVFYDNSPLRAIRDSYPDQFFEWEFSRVPEGFWEGKRGYLHAQEAVKWFAGKRGIDSIADCKKIESDDFAEEGLSSMLQQVFGDSPFLALKVIFPDMMPWEAKVTPRGFLDSPTNQKIAVDSYLMSYGVQPIHGLNPEETYDCGLRKFVSKESMGNFGLRGLLARFGGSPYRLFNFLYPEQMLPWTLSTSHSAWRENPRETAAKAVRWLFEEYLAIPLEEIPFYATDRLFRRVGFSGILTNRSIGFNSSNYAALDNAYPGYFSKEDFRRSREIGVLETKNLQRKRNKAS